MAVNPKSLANLNPPQRPGDPPLNPSGRPKGTHSVRVALKRKLRRGWQEDEENEDGEKIGAWARQLAEDLADAIDAGDADKVRSIATLMDQTDGKPQERIEHSGEIKRVTINLEARPPEIEAP